MHELGIMAEVVRVVENIARQQNLTKIDALVLQIGELSSVVPYYAEQCYPAASYGTMLENTRLEIEVLPGNARCRNCGRVFNVVENHRKCPDCGGTSMEFLGGREFMIKEIVAC
ncbi:MAG: hydrogenase maturation nickel metallochaperone HypA [Eubacteriales bacterium]